MDTTKVPVTVKIVFTLTTADEKKTWVTNERGVLGAHVQLDQLKVGQSLIINKHNVGVIERIREDTSPTVVICQTESWPIGDSGEGTYNNILKFAPKLKRELRNRGYEITV